MTPSPGRPIAEDQSTDKLSTMAVFETAVSKAHTKVKECFFSADSGKDDSSIVGPYWVSTTMLPGYATLDLQHLREIQTLVASIRCYAKDRSRRRPLNFLLHAEPGSGKSHFVECLAQKLSDERVKDVAFNMTSMREIEDLAAPIDRVRDLKVADRLPLLFLDEFDSDPRNFARLLPVLWDGKLDVGGRLLQTGKMVVILAGSSSRIAQISAAAKSLEDKTTIEDGKLIDLLSRINGGEISIPSLDENSPDRDRRVDKVCLAAALLLQRFGKSLRRVPWALLRFIVDTKFRHGSRSIATLLDMIPSMDADTSDLTLDKLHLPLGDVNALRSSSLVYHLAKTEAEVIVNSWGNLEKSLALVAIAEEETFVSRLIEHLRNEPFVKQAL